MTHIYLIRHAEAEGNLYRRFHGWYNSRITENGYRQIEALAARFADVPVDAVYSSDLFRTCTTAEAIWKTHGLKLQTRSDLREIGVGKWEDVAWGELERNHAEDLARFSHSSPEFHIPGGETFAQVQDRLEQALVEIAAAHPDQTVAVFSHGTAIRCLQARLRGLAPGEMDSLGHSDNTAVTYIRLGDGKVELVYENDSSHLPEEISTLGRQKWWRAKKGRALDANLWFLPLKQERNETYFQLLERAWQEMSGQQKPLDRAQAARLSADSTVVCGMLRDEPVGLLQLAPSLDGEQRIGEIQVLYMLPEYRKKGLGIQMVGEATSLYRPRGCQVLRMCCAPGAQEAQPFCAEYGFVKKGQKEKNGILLNIMEKYIGYEHH